MRGIGVAIVLAGMAIVAMMVIQPSLAWAWALILVLCIPAVVVAAVTFKLLVLFFRRVARVR